MSKRELKFVGIDYWSRPMFKDKKGFWFCCLDKLFLDNATFEKVTEKVTEADIVYHGLDLEDDPMGVPIKQDKIILVKEFSINE